MCEYVYTERYSECSKLLGRYYWGSLRLGLPQNSCPTLSAFPQVYKYVKMTQDRSPGRDKPGLVAFPLPSSSLGGLLPGVCEPREAKALWPCGPVGVRQRVGCMPTSLCAPGPCLPGASALSLRRTERLPLQSPSCLNQDAPRD